MTDTAGGHGRAVAVPGFGRVSVGDEDRHQTLTYLALGGIALGLVLARFGMPPVELHLPTHWMGLMGPTCGMTRGVAATLRGDLGSGLTYNPASLVLVLGAVLSLVRAAAGAVTGRWVTIWLSVTRGGWGLILTGLVLLWINQQLHADLLMGR